MSKAARGRRPSGTTFFTDLHATFALGNNHPEAIFSEQLNGAWAWKYPLVEVLWARQEGIQGNLMVVRKPGRLIRSGAFLRNEIGGFDGYVFFGQGIRSVDQPTHCFME